MRQFHRLHRQLSRAVDRFFGMGGHAEPVQQLEPRRLLAAIASDQTLAGAIGVLGEADEYTFDANVGESFVAFVAETATAAFDPQIELIAPNAASLTVDYGEVGADIALNNLPQSGTYTLRVTDSGGNDTGDYAITLAKLPGAQLPAGDGGTLPAGPRVNGTIGAGDLDVFTIPVAAGDQIFLDAVEGAGSPGFEPHVLVYNTVGAPVISDYGDVGADVQFTASAAGTYYVVVKDFVDDNVGFNADGDIDMGDYIVTMARVPGPQVDDGSDGGALLFGGPRIQGTISLGDLDVYTVHASPGDQVHLNVVEDGANTGFEPQVFVYSPAGALVITDYGAVGADVAFTAAVSGDYYVLVKDVVDDNVGFNADGDFETGNYVITMTKFPGLHIDDAGDSGMLSSGPRVNGTISLGDMDVFTVQGSPGDRVILTVVESGANTGFEPQVFVYGPTGTLVISDYGAVGAEVEFAPSSAGTYYVMVKDVVDDNVGFNADGDFEAGSYTLTMAKLAGTQTDDQTDGGPLQSGPRVRGRIDLGDIDVFTVLANPGDRVLLMAVEDNGSGFEPQISVFGPDGTPVISDYGAFGVEVGFTPTASGTFYIVVRDIIDDNVGFNADGDFEPGEYFITMAKLPDVQTDDAGDGGPLSSGQRVVGANDVADMDVWTVSLDVGDSLIGVARGLELAGYEAQVLVYSPTGTLLDSTNGSTDFSFAASSVTEAGTYYIVVRDLVDDNVGFNADGDIERGDYAMTVVVTPGAQPTDADSGPLTSGQVRAGSISSGDADVYTFPVTAGQSFTLNLAETSASGFEPSFRLFNPAGGVVTTQSNASAATFTLANPPSSGTYTVVVYDDNGAESGPYSIALDTAVGADTFAPRVLAAEYRFNTAPPELRAIFSESVGASFSSNDVEITNLDTNMPVSNALLSITYEAANDLFKVSFPALPGRVLPDGNYRLRVAQGNLTDAAGNPLDQDLVHDFFVLAGDANRDGTVNLIDFNRLAANFGKTARQFSTADYNYDGTVDLSDFNVLASRFGSSVAPVAEVSGVSRGRAAGSGMTTRFGDSTIVSSSGDDDDAAEEPAALPA